MLLSEIVSDGPDPRKLTKLTPAEARSYVSALLAVAASDGIADIEMAYIELQARIHGIPAADVFDEAVVDLGGLREQCSAPVRRMIVRDCINLACIDRDYTAPERAAIQRIADQLGISRKRLGALEAWTAEHRDVVERGEQLLYEEE